MEKSRTWKLGWYEDHFPSLPILRLFSLFALCQGRLANRQGFRFESLGHGGTFGPSAAWGDGSCYWGYIGYIRLIIG